VEQVRLVLEVPVHGAARHASVARDLIETGVGYSLVQKQPLGGGEDGDAGLLGFFFGSAHGQVRR